MRSEVPYKRLLCTDLNDEQLCAIKLFRAEKKTEWSQTILMRCMEAKMEWITKDALIQI
jgi:hypothetical protein